MRVAFLGLGIMGQSMASNLVKAGHEVTVWNRTPGKLVEGAGSGAYSGGSGAGKRKWCGCASPTPTRSKK
jgi:3-hydroxyisobutyrate dehydrogenase-like beta-hydroxyacid dehydrogenase